MRDTEKKAYNDGRYLDARRILLEDAQTKPAQALVQVDVHVTEGDSIMVPDEDGHCIMSGETYELRRTPGELVPVRVHIDPSADKDDVLEMLAKVYSSVSHNWGYASGEVGEGLPF